MVSQGLVITSGPFDNREKVDCGTKLEIIFWIRVSAVNWWPQSVKALRYQVKRETGALTKFSQSFPQWQDSIIFFLILFKSLPIFSGNGYKFYWYIQMIANVNCSGTFRWWNIFRKENHKSWIWKKRNIEANEGNRVVLKKMARMDLL